MTIVLFLNLFFFSFVFTFFIMKALKKDENYEFVKVRNNYLDIDVDHKRSRMNVKNNYSRPLSVKLNFDFSNSKRNTFLNNYVQPNKSFSVPMTEKNYLKCQVRETTGRMLKEMKVALKN